MPVIAVASSGHNVGSSGHNVCSDAIQLTKTQIDRATRMRDAWRDAFGDDQLIRDLLDAGMIHGWRDVESVELIGDLDEKTEKPSQDA